MSRPSGGLAAIFVADLGFALVVLLVFGRLPILATDGAVLWGWGGENRLVWGLAIAGVFCVIGVSCGLLWYGSKRVAALLVLPCFAVLLYMAWLNLFVSGLRGG